MIATSNNLSAKGVPVRGRSGGGVAAILSLVAVAAKLALAGSSCSRRARMPRTRRSTFLVG